MQGAVISLELFVQSAPAPFRGLEFVFPCAANDADATAGSIKYVADTGIIDHGREQFVFSGCGTAFAVVDDGCNPDIRFADVLGTGDCYNAMSTPSYAGQINVEVSSDAAGSFTFDFSSAVAIDRSLGILPGLVPEPLIIHVGCPPVPCGDDLDCRCGDDDSCTTGRCVGDVCVYGPTMTEDVNRDGIVNLFDIFCVLDAFQGHYDHCGFADVDIGGCGGDGIVDIYDIFAVLDAFGGRFCPSSCGHVLLP